jgi:hypothetical protein
MLLAIKKTWTSILTAIPIIIGVLLLIEILNPLLEKLYPKVFTGNLLLDPVLGALAGSLSFGIPVISYVTGGELLKLGVSLLAVTAFILSWSSVGIVTLPIESSCMGKKFAIARNSINFITSIIISILVLLTINALK